MAGERGRQGFITTQWQGFREAGHRWQERGTGGRREAQVARERQWYRQTKKHTERITSGEAEKQRDGVQRGRETERP